MYKKHCFNICRETRCPTCDIKLTITEILYSQSTTEYCYYTAIINSGGVIRAVGLSKDTA